MTAPADSRISDERLASLAVSIERASAQLVVNRTELINLITELRERRAQAGTAESRLYCHWCRTSFNTVQERQEHERERHAATDAAPPPAQAAGVMEWQPIETAPKDGTDIILGSPEQTYNGNPVAARATVGHWTTEEECRVDIGDCGGECHCREYEYVEPFWLSWDGGFTAENPPTHWRPLPEPPASFSAQDREE